MNVVEILMRRDGCTREEAEQMVIECRNRCEDCLAAGDYDGVEDAIADELGLEPDYTEEILGF